MASWVRNRDQRGLSLAELLLAVSLAGLAGVVGVPALSHSAAHARSVAATRHLWTTIHATRVEAVRRGRPVALRFEPGAAGMRFRRYLDGNGNGVRSADIASGVDRPLGPADALSDHFGDVDFRVAADVPGIDGGPVVPAGSNPIRLGPSSMASWSPAGSATSGTLYLAGPRGNQFAVRIFGSTGRVRAFRYDSGAAEWRPL
ncbi:MAG: Tfp pilus assembly protein FimT/FimU [Vicinamibacteria bacterium]